jgi:four helix bundle protein
MTYEEWASGLPAGLTADVIWRVQAYRLALFLTDCVERDTRDMATDGRFGATITQVVRAAGSVGATIAEGYPRQSAKDRVRYYEYALGSAGEVKSWYVSARFVLGDPILEDRFAIITSITRLLLTMIRSASQPTLSSTRLSSRPQ